MSIGYACLTVGVENTKMSSCILKNASSEHLRKLILANLCALQNITQYNKKNNIRLFRISSDIIPFGSHPRNQILWWKEFREELAQVGNEIKEANIRVSMHPGQYTVLNSPDSNVVERAVMDLEYHDRFLTALGMGDSSKMILHVGGAYGDKKNSIKRFITNYEKLSKEIKKRLVIENDERIYNIEEVLSISNQIDIPVVFDNLHHQIHPPTKSKSISDWILECSKSWSDQDGIQKVHYSQQKPGAKPGSHSDTIELVDFMNYYNELSDPNIDIMLEVKDKNLSAVKCINEVEKQSEAII